MFHPNPFPGTVVSSRIQVDRLIWSFVLLYTLSDVAGVGGSSRCFISYFIRHAPVSAKTFLKCPIRRRKSSPSIQFTTASHRPTIVRVILNLPISLSIITLVASPFSVAHHRPSC